MFPENKKFFCPRVYCYFDDVFSNHHHINEHNGELLAIKEFNDNNEEIVELIDPSNLENVVPAIALTIHKSQGLTLESCSVDLGSGAFATGQAYVALSRCKNLNSLHLQRELKVSDALVDPDIIDFHRNNLGN